MAYQQRTNSVNPGDLVGLFGSHWQKYRVAVYLGNDRLAILYERSKRIDDQLLNMLMKLDSINISDIQPKEVVSLSSLRRDQYEPYLINVLETPFKAYKGNTQEFYKVLTANFKVFDTLNKGDIVKFEGSKFSLINYVFYHHMAIFSDEERFLIVHKSGEPNVQNISEKSQKSLVQENPIMDEAAFRYIGIANDYENTYKINPPDIIVAKARKRINEKSYDLFGDNCQHFCNSCRYNENISREVRSYTTTFAALAIGAAASIAAIFVARNSTNQEKEEEEKKEDSQ